MLIGCRVGRSPKIRNIWTHRNIVKSVLLITKLARPPTTTADLISSSTDEHQDRYSGSDDEEGNWLDGGDITDYLTPRYSIRPLCATHSCSWRSVDRLDTKGGG